MNPLRAGLAVLAASCAVAAGAVPAGAPQPVGWGESRLGRYVVENYGARLGFPKTVVLTAVQTRDGYIWIGTGSGLLRFDGVRFATFLMSNTPALASNYVGCLCEDGAGTLWIGTERGLVQYRRGVFEPVGPRNVEIHALASAPDGPVWVGTGGRGLYRMEGGRMIDANPPGGLPSPRIAALFVDRERRLWIGFMDGVGVDCRDPETHHFKFYGANPDSIDAFAEWPAGTLWFGSRFGPLYRCRGGIVTHVTTTPAITAGAQILGLLAAPGGGLWIAAGNVAWIGDADHPVVQPVPGLPRTDVRALTEDSEQGLWICARESGLFRAPAKHYMILSRDTGLPGDRAKTVSIDPAGNLWTTLDGHGIAEVSPGGRVTARGATDGFTSELPRTLYPSADGSLWVALKHGVDRWRDGKRVDHIRLREVQGLYEDRTGTLWIGSNVDGLFRYRDGRLGPPVVTATGRPFLFATSFAEAADGTLYVGAWRQGILVYRHGQVESFDPRNGLPSDEVRALRFDSKGRLWAGFGTWGLAMMADGRWWTSAAVSEKLMDHVSAILEDKDRRLWFGTPAGICFAPEDALAATFEGKGPVPQFRTVDLANQTDEPAVWSGAQPTAWEGPDGRLVFATHEGVIVLDPADFPADEPVPTVNIESAGVDRRTIAFPNSLQVPAAARRVEIAFSAPNFDEPGDLRYEFRLDGVDPEWTADGGARQATYASLPPGRFLFRVRAAGGDGRWGPDARLSVVVAPLIWQRRWVQFAALAAFTLAVVALVRYVSFHRLRRRLRELEQRAAVDKERARIARDIHDAIGNRMTEIILLSRLASGRNGVNGEREEFVRQIGASARSVTDSLDEIVWAMSPRRDSLPHLVAYLSEFAVEFLRTAGVACHVERPAEIPARPLTADVRHNVFLAAKEALNNVVRHSRASEAWLEFQVGPQEASIVLRDNGCGLPAQAPKASSDGLQNMAHRLEEIGGRFTIHTPHAGGTVVRFDFPCPSAPRSPLGVTLSG